MGHEKLHQRKIMSVTNLTQNILKRLWNVRKTSDKKACLYFRLFLTKYILQIYQTRIILSLTLYYLTPLWFSSPTSVGTTIFIDMDVDINQLIIYICFKSSISLKWKTILRYIYFSCFYRYGFNLYIFTSRWWFIFLPFMHIRYKQR